MRNWIRRFLTLLLPALMMVLSSGGAEARMGYGYPAYGAAAQQQAVAPNYGYLYGNQNPYGSLPAASQTASTTGIAGYGSQSGQSWQALAAQLSGGEGVGAAPGSCPWCAQGGGGAGSCPWCQQSAAAQDGFGGGGACPYCPTGNCPWCQQNGNQQDGPQFAAAQGGFPGGLQTDGGSCPWCQNGNCPYCQNGNCPFCPSGNCPWCNQDQAPVGNQQLEQVQGFGQARGYQAMQGAPYGI